MYHMYILYIFDIWMFSGTAGGIGSVMAALGALKLGALTILNADSLDIETRWWFIGISVLVIYWYISIGDILVYWSHIGALKVGALTLIHADYLDIEKRWWFGDNHGAGSCGSSIHGILAHLHIFDTSAKIRLWKLSFLPSYLQGSLKRRKKHSQE